MFPVSCVFCGLRRHLLAIPFTLMGEWKRGGTTMLRPVRPGTALSASQRRRPDTTADASCSAWRFPSVCWLKLLDEQRLDIRKVRTPAKIPACILNASKPSEFFLRLFPEISLFSLVIHINGSIFFVLRHPSVPSEEVSTARSTPHAPAPITGPEVPRDEVREAETRRVSAPCPDGISPSS